MEKQQQQKTTANQTNKKSQSTTLHLISSRSYLQNPGNQTRKKNKKNNNINKQTKTNSSEAECRVDVIDSQKTQFYPEKVIVFDIDALDHSLGIPSGLLRHLNIPFVISFNV